MDNNIVCFIVIIVAVIIFLSYSSSFRKDKNRDGYSTNLKNSVAKLCDNVVGYQYQYYPPSTRAEVNYTTNVLENCHGLGDVECLQKAHLQTFREDGGMDYKDIPDMICGTQCGVNKYSKEYYNCLGQMYSDYRYP